MIELNWTVKPNEGIAVYPIVRNRIIARQTYTDAFIHIVRNVIGGYRIVAGAIEKPETFQAEIDGVPANHILVRGALKKNAVIAIGRKWYCRSPCSTSCSTKHSPVIVLLEMVFPGDHVAVDGRREHDAVGTVAGDGVAGGCIRGRSIEEEPAHTAPQDVVRERIVAGAAINMYRGVGPEKTLC